MKNQFLNIKSVAFLLLMAFGFAACQAQSSKDGFRLIELVTLNDGYQVEDHLAYGQKIEHILNRYDMQNTANFKVLKKAKGSAADHVVKVGVFELNNPESLKKVFGDQEYNEKMVPERNKIHDMANMTFFLTKPIFEKKYNKSKMVVMDFVVMQEGHDTEERDQYFDKMLGKYGKKYGLKRFAAYEVIQFMRGVGPKGTTLINFYEATPEVVKNLVSDKGYQAEMVPVRDKIFDMDELTVFMTQPVK